MSAPTERQAHILDLVKREGFLSVEILAQRIGVSPELVQNDVNQLCEQGLMQAQDSGATTLSSVENIAYSIRQALCHEAKELIARDLARHIPDHSSLFINIGTTTEEVAKALLGHKGLRVVTNNLNVASILSVDPALEVIVAGGIVRSRDRGIVGEATVDLIRQFRLDFAIIGISAIDSSGALLDFDYREVRVTQAIVANSRQVFLAADHSKFSRNAMVRVGHVSQLDALFTDRQPTPEMQAKLAAAKVAVHIAMDNGRMDS
ncbi:MAG: DeoR family transcriptional regulator [Gammaproteobacteria bacterium]|nr:DeoR family transcriptional regulator [Gammaproteobacteria bacterium]MCP5459305.1 DeoR family transcriptional regulator [Gammaproteobacteria bacterium]